MNRHSRRAAQKINRNGDNDTTASQKMSEALEGFKEMQGQIAKLVQLYRNNFNSILMIKETLERKGLISIDDLKETERLYKENAENRDKRVKEIYAKNMTDEEKIDFCLTDYIEYKHGYLKQNISPVKDLGVAPNVVNDYLMSKGYTGLKYREYAIFLGVPEFMLSKAVVGQHEQGQRTSQPIQEA